MEYHIFCFFGRLAQFQGIGADNRIGDVIRFLRADVTLSWTYGDPSNVCRFMAFWNLGMPPTGWTAGDFLDHGPSGVPDVYSQAYPYLRNRRYLLLYDRTDVVNNSTAQQVTHQISFPINIVTGKQIGRASCRERVCLYV